LYQTNLFVASVKRGVAFKILLCYVLSVKWQVHQWHLKIQKVEKDNYGLQK
jgi:hypothetical protein